MLQPPEQSVRIVGFGSQKKYEAARKLRTQRVKGYYHSTQYRRKGGYRYLTESELQDWYARLNRAMGRKVKVS